MGEICKRSFLLPILCLVLADQSIKRIISFFFMKCNFTLIENLIRFNPVVNTKSTWIGNHIDIFIFTDWGITVLLNIVVIFIFISGYAFYRQKSKDTGIFVKIIVICGMAGSICGLIDRAIWGGSLDFIQIPGLFTFDLKDCYTSVACMIFVVLGLMHSKEISIKEYLHFLRGRLT